MPLIQQTLQTFPAVNGAITHDQGKARYCINLQGMTAEQAKLLISQIHNTIDLVLIQIRNDDK